MTATAVSDCADTVWEEGEEQAQPKVFLGLPVYTELAIAWPEDDPEEAQTQGVTRWAVCLYRDEEDAEGWVTADVIGLPGVASEGRTEERAIANVKEALTLSLQALQEAETGVRHGYAMPPGGRVIYVTL